MRRRGRIERRVEVFAQRRAERSLVAALDLDALDDRREKVLRALVEDALQRARLGLDRLQLASASASGLRMSCSAARAASSAFSAGKRVGLDVLGRAFPAVRTCSRRASRAIERRDPRDARRPDRARSAASWRDAAAALRQPRARSFRTAPCGCAPAPSSAVSSANSLLADGNRRARPLRPPRQVRRRARRYWRPRRSVPRLPREPFQDVGIVGDHRLLRGQCRRQAGRCAARVRGGGRRCAPTSSSIWLRAIVRRWSGGGGLGLVLAQFRQAWAPIACSLAALALRLRLSPATVGRSRQARFAPPPRCDFAAVQRRWNSSASVRRMSAERFEAVGLPRLALQAVDLGFELRRRRLPAARGSARRRAGAVRPRGGASAGRKCRRPLPAARGAPAAWPGSARRCGPARPWRASARRSRRRRTAAARPWRGLRCR